MPSEKPYSVLLLRPDYVANDYGQDTYYTFVMAKDRNAAVRKAQHEAQQADLPPDMRGDPKLFKDSVDYHPLLVLDGHQPPV